MAQISFFEEQVQFHLTNQIQIRKWIKHIVKQESNKKIDKIDIIFCTDEYLYTLNKSYLHHDTLTDILTFNYSGDPDILDAEIYISIDRVRENCKTYKVNFSIELHRVLIHGILHLVGFNDKTKYQRQIMREKENEYLTLYTA
jgi:rRNA maturation RNase YbeY